MSFDYKLISTSSESIVTLDEAKLQARVYDDYDNLYLSQLIEVGTDIAKEYLNREILASTVQIQTDRVDMKLPRGVANAVTEVSYELADVNDGTRYVLDSSYYNFDDITGCIHITKAGYDFLSNVIPFRWRITFTTGWDLNTVPTAIKQAILIIVASLYENREAQAVGSGITVANIGLSPQYLLDKYRVRRIG